MQNLTSQMTAREAYAEAYRLIRITVSLFDAKVDLDVRALVGDDMYYLALASFVAPDPSDRMKIIRILRNRHHNTEGRDFGSLQESVRLSAYMHYWSSNPISGLGDPSPAQQRQIAAAEYRMETTFGIDPEWNVYQAEV